MRDFQSTFFAIAMLLAAFVPGLVNAISLPTPTELAPMLARDAKPSSSPGVEARLSNSARFQRGLGPRRPRQLYNATRAILPRTSNSPSTPYLAEVAYVSEPDTVVGWLGAMLLAAGNEALFTHVGDADLFYAPDNVPATDAVLTTDSGQYTGFFTVSKTSTTSSSTMFTITPTTTSESPIWDLSDFDSSGRYISMRYALGTTTYKLYLYPIVDGSYTTYTLYGGESAAAINAAYSLAIPESDEVLVTLVRSS